VAERPELGNHRAIFEGCGFTVQSYPYFDPLTGSVRFEEMLASLRACRAQRGAAAAAATTRPAWT
jgi:aspartate/tyrosine/aromatic aminotransferase